MKLHALTALFLSIVALSGTSTPAARAQRHPHHRGHVAPKQRQAPVVDAASPGAPGSSSTGPSSSAAPQPVSSSASTPAGSPNVPQPSPSAAGSGLVTVTMTTTTTTLPTPVVPVPSGTNGVPPLPLISSGMSTGTPSPVASTYAVGATPPVSGAPPLPTPCASLLPFFFVCIRVITYALEFF